MNPLHSVDTVCVTHSQSPSSTTLHPHSLVPTTLLSYGLVPLPFTPHKPKEIIVHVLASQMCTRSCMCLALCHVLHCTSMSVQSVDLGAIVGVLLDPTNHETVESKTSYRPCLGVGFSKKMVGHVATNAHTYARRGLPIGEAWRAFMFRLC